MCYEHRHVHNKIKVYNLESKNIFKQCLHCYILQAFLAYNIQIILITSFHLKSSYALNCSGINFSLFNMIPSFKGLILNRDESFMIVLDVTF